MDATPNYSAYTYDELLDAKAHIDKEAYPERYNEILALLNDNSFKAKNAEEIAEHNHLYRYSTFWPRFWAGFVDGLLFTLVIYLECLFFGIEYSTEDNLLQAINGVQIAIYVIIMHGLYGQTLGKMLTGVKVLDHDTETEINVKQAVRRESVNLILNVLLTTLTVTFLFSTNMSTSTIENLSYFAVMLGALSFIWLISEFVTMLFNNKRRALHDFIGKTVVVRL
jgi:uncharacterized RDD family membrane protein YckC